MSVLFWTRFAAFCFNLEPFCSVLHQFGYILQRSVLIWTRFAAFCITLDAFCSVLHAPLCIDLVSFCSVLLRFNAVLLRYALIWCPFAPFERHQAPFWRPWLPFRRHLAHCWRLLAPFRSISSRFTSAFAPIWIPLAPFSSLYLLFGILSVRFSVFDLSCSKFLRFRLFEGTQAAWKSSFAAPPSEGPKRNLAEGNLD